MADIYAIWDNRTKTFYKREDRKFWNTKNGAKDALMFDLRFITVDTYKKHFLENEVTSTWLKTSDRKVGDHYLSFRDQTRYECRRYCLIESDYEIV